MNKKGFMAILVSIGIIVMTMVMLSGNNYYGERMDFSRQIVDAKLKITNYEIIITQATKDCNWDKEQNEIRDCVNTNNTELIRKIFENGELDCGADYVVDKSAGKAEGTIICSQEIITSETIFSMDLNKNITIQKN